MGTPVTISIRDLESCDAVLDRAFEDLRDIDAKYSPFLPGSLVSQVNRGELMVGEHPDLEALAGLCRLYEAATDGVFTAWHGGAFDPSGLVKGWAIDRCCSLLEAAGARRYLVDAGGDVYARGGRADGEPWRVGIRHPIHPQDVVRVVVGFDLAVATSGTYQKGEHIWNRVVEAQPLLSFSVVGPDIVEADVFATAGFALGLAGLNLIESKAGFEAYAIDASLIARWTSGFDSRFDAGGQPRIG